MTAGPQETRSKGRRSQTAATVIGSHFPCPRGDGKLNLCPLSLNRPEPSIGIVMKITSACWLLMVAATPVAWAQNPAAAPTASPPAAAGAKPDAGAGTNRNQRFGRDPALDAFYKLGPDSQPQEGVPKGRIDGPKVISSEV